MCTHIQPTYYLYKNNAIYIETLDDGLGVGIFLVFSKNKQFLIANVSIKNLIFYLKLFLRFKIGKPFEVEFIFFLDKK